jgi:hypothetical protein
MAHKAQQRGGHSNRDRGRRSDGYQLGGDVPWPVLGDGTEWADALVRVQHKHVPEWTGRLQSVEWCHPDGSYMKERGRTMAATKTKGERYIPHAGEWYGQVSWDRKDDPDRPTTRQKLAALVPEGTA